MNTLFIFLFTLLLSSIYIADASKKKKKEPKVKHEKTAALWAVPIKGLLPHSPTYVYVAFSTAEDITKASETEINEKLRLGIYKPWWMGGNKYLEKVPASQVPKVGEYSIEKILVKGAPNDENVEEDKERALSEVEYEFVTERIKGQKYVYRINVNVPNSVRFLFKKRLQLVLTWGSVSITALTIAKSPFIRVLRRSGITGFAKDIEQKCSQCTKSIKGYYGEGKKTIKIASDGKTAWDHRNK